MNTTENGNPKLFERNDIKYPFMQMGYGQQENGTIGQLKNDMGEKYFDGVYDIFIQAVNDVVPGFIQVMEFINNCWNPEWEMVAWTLPDGFIAQCKPTSSEWEDFKLFDAISIQAKVSGVRKEKQSLILYVGFIHSLDAYIAREVVRRSPFDVVTIHDAFKCHPNNVNQMQKIYREILVDMNNLPLFQTFLAEITGSSVSDINGNLKTEDILNSKYAIC